MADPSQLPPTLRSIALSLCLASVGLLFMVGASRAEPVPACSLAAAFDGGNGEFNGMSHSGTRLLLRNEGGATCLVEGLPSLTFEDWAGRSLPIVRRAPVGMHPGPVVMPLTVAPGATVETSLRWVSGDAFTPGVCRKPRRIVIGVEPHALHVRWPGGRLCGPAGGTIPFEQPPLQPVATGGR